MCTVTPIAIAELLRLLDQHVPQLLRPLAEAAVRAEHEREELDADRLALNLGEMCREIVFRNRQQAAFTF